MKEKYLIILLIAISMFGILTHFADKRDLLDEPHYVKVVEFFRTGVMTEPSPYALRLLIPFIVSISPINVYTSFYILNAIFWIATTLLLYLFVKELYKDNNIAFFAAFFFATSIPLLIYAIQTHVDMGAYFFAMIGVYALNRYKNSTSIKHYLLLSTIIVLAVTAKETNIFLLATIWFLEFTNKKRNINKILLISFIVFSYVFLLQAAIGNTYYNTPVGDLNAVIRNSAPELLPPRLGTVVIAFNLTWLLAYIGYRNEINSERKRFLKMIFLSLVPIQIFSFFTAAYGTRIVILFFPAIMSLAALGLKKFVSGGKYLSTNQRTISILAAYFIISNIVALPFVEMPF